MTEYEHIKNFEIQPKSDSDNFDKEERGIFYTCSGSLVKDYETGSINGDYREIYPDNVCEENNIPTGKKEIVNVNFDILSKDLLSL